jgi:hypothetical protein
MPDDAKPDTVQQDSSPKPLVPPVTEQQVGSPDAAQVAKEDVNTKIENLGDELHAAEKWMIWLTGAIAFFGLCTVVVGALQWSAMRGQLQEMKAGGVDTHILAQATKDSAELTRKQMEGTSAAVIEVTKPINVYFPIPLPVPLFAQTRINLRNSGHVIARDVHLVLSVSTQDTGKRNLHTVVFSATDVLPAIAPSMFEDRPDRSYSFQVTKSEYERLMKTSDYIVAEGTIDYDNGFGLRTNQRFCYASVWGTRIGSWAGECDEVGLQIKTANAPNGKNPN